MERHLDDPLGVWWEDVVARAEVEELMIEEERMSGGGSNILLYIGGERGAKSVSNQMLGRKDLPRELSYRSLPRMVSVELLRRIDCTVWDVQIRFSSMCPSLLSAEPRILTQLRPRSGDPPFLAEQTAPESMRQPQQRPDPHR